MSTWYTPSEYWQIAVVNDLVLKNVRECDQYWVTSDDRRGESEEIAETSPDVWSRVLTAIRATAVLQQTSVTASAPEWLSDWILFQKLASEWQENRNRLNSFAGDLMRDPSYLRIVGMGQKAVPFILWRLQSELRAGEPNQWFPALWAITGENPVPEQHRGKIREMAEAWIQWGIEEGHTRGEGLGEAFSQSR